ncbi:MAG: DUF2314 domain-containing protein [Desulfobacteraceae bacterium]|nr:MAG: DUF2314 domain-containing protein [Desulfobacteraceae bacterium]
MKKHPHNFNEAEWPFEFPVNRVVYTTDQIMKGNSVINLVMHDNDGDWQFLPGTSVETEECAAVCAGCIYEKFPYIGDFSRLEPGWEIYRDTEDSEWILFNTEFDLPEDEYPYPRIIIDGFKLELIEQDEKDDYRFELSDFPTEDERFSVNKGDFVKIIFKYKDGVVKDDLHISSERMWVEVIEANGPTFSGRLDNDPNYSSLFQSGLIVKFHAKHIVQIFSE